MRYFADTLSIEKFRKIENQEIKLSKRITVFSGQNGVGKSNLMSLIATTFGQSKSRIGRGSFQPEFSDYFTIPPTEDYSNYNTYIKVTVSDKKSNFLQKRHGYKNDTTRKRGIRLIPRVTNHYSLNRKVKDINQETVQLYSIGSSGRIPVPTIFLSLSRLFPVGETDLSHKNVTLKNKLFKNGSIQKYIEWYNAVLPGSVSEKTDEVIILDKNKIESDGIYIAPDDTTESTQSVGQDNLRGIINALVDFKNLKEKDPSNYHGGILCIDEIDASLHPSAQLRLLSLLDDLCDELDLQIFLTTHSLTILKKIIELKQQNEDDYNLIYLIDPIQPKVGKIENYESLKADLFDDEIVHNPQVKFYCEDKSTEFLIDELRKASKSLFHNIRILDDYDIVPVHLGANQLKKLPKYDEHFNKVGIVLDGDAKTNVKYLLNSYINNKKNIKTISQLHEKRNNIMFLPTFLAPESYMYYIIYNLYHNPDFRSFWDKIPQITGDMYHTKARVNMNILSKISVTESTSNETIKKSIDTKKMMKFIKDTEALSNYYDKTEENDLKSFILKFNSIINSTSKQLKSSY